MARKVVDTLESEEFSVNTLDTLIPMYAENKAELDSYKELCDKENAEIKRQMFEQGKEEYVVSGFKAKRTVVVKESLNQDKLLQILKKHNIEGVIKTQEYVDMDALEDYLYNNTPTNELATDLASCKSKTEVVQLRVSVVKNKE